MNTQKRIQRKRSPGWRMPENTKCVNRLSKFANPFFIHSGILCFRSNYRKMERFSPLKYVGYNKADNHKLLVDCFKKLIDGEKKFYGVELEFLLVINDVYIPTKEEIKTQLSNYEHLACFCNLGLDCHVDVLIDIINCE